LDLLQIIRHGFDAQSFLKQRAKAVFLAKEKPKKSRKIAVDGTTNLELFELLRQLRNQIAEREDLIHYQIFTQKALYAICETLPVTKTHLSRINGMGKVRIEKYGTAILEVVKNYCKYNF